MIKLPFPALVIVLAALTLPAQEASLDLTFVPGTNQNLTGIALQVDGQIVAVGRANNEITHLFPQPDGKIWLAGLFITFDGKPRVRLARIYGDALPPAAPSIISPILSGTSFSFTVSTVGGLTYTLEYKEVLSDPLWSSLPPVPGDGTVKTLTDPTATGSTRFYRVRVD